ncbi:hypothetical protein MTR67_044995 [Solanum verrucosum]|uniref:NB-ARC domain containing protein n=1 Tax=Solanum verrucosum TaxID=315347 RepID=A0AAF0URV7_SOLVR|nr:hypothetical protein MTR67_044995 [Solanum verrucosum]
MRQSDKHTPGELHDAIQVIKSDMQLENLAIDGKEKIAESECGNLKPLEAIDLQVEISSCDENATGNWNTIAQKNQFLCVLVPWQVEVNLHVLKISNRVEKELELIDSNPSKEKTLVRADPDSNIQSVSTPIGNDKILAKGMSPLSQANFTNDLLISKEKQQGEMSTPRWADLVDEEEHVSPPLLNRKLSPQALEFVPKSTTAKKNEQDALASGFSPINAYASDLGDDSFDEDEDEDEDEEDNMLDICFDKVTRDGDISPRHQRSGSNKNKKKTHGRQHNWDGKVIGEFVPMHMPMRLAKQSHMTVSIALTRSNTFKNQ